MSERSPEERSASAEERARRREASRQHIGSAYARDYRRSTRPRIRLWHLITIAVFVGAAGLGFALTNNSASAPRHLNAAKDGSSAPSTQDAIELRPASTAATTTTQSVEHRGHRRATRKPSSEYVFHIGPITTAQASQMTGVSWHSGCPVQPSELRKVYVAYHGFDGKRHIGQLIVNQSVAEAVVKVFRTLFALRFPIHEMRPVEAYGGSDFQSIEHDNTSSFNCRLATGSTNWSQHAYGLAIDLDPLENPYLSNGQTVHSGSEKYLDRSQHFPGMIHHGDGVYQAFRSIGWGWGGDWSGTTQDLQHFSSTGR